MSKVVIVGAGIGGLSTAVELAKAGMDVTVLEAHSDSGGCAATFYHQGYHFDAGATLAGGFAPGGPLDTIGKRFNIDWQAIPAEVAMQVHLSDGSNVTRWSEPQHWEEERRSIFGERAEGFWHWQEHTADRLWQLAKRLPAWPPQTFSDFVSIGVTGLNWLYQLPFSDYTQIIRSAMGSTNKFLPQNNERLRQFIDAQLLISAQTTSLHANALYSAAALDLARQGVAHLPGGMGSIAHKLAEVLLRYGGSIHYRQCVTQICRTKNRQFEIKTERGKMYLANTVIFNLPPSNIKQLLGDAAPKRLHQLPQPPTDAWGAFMVYLGIPDHIVPPHIPLHQQIIRREPLGEGNSIFLSLSPSWDPTRAPKGQRAATISTHTKLATWWKLHTQDFKGYEARKAVYTENILAACEQVLPGIRNHANLVLSGTPVTFQRFTRREGGWVGGFPQTNLFQAWGPRLAPNLWMVGDSIFPGQSVPAVALGGLRVAQAILSSYQSIFSFTKLIPNRSLRTEDLT